MSGEVELRLEKLAGRYELSGQAEWQKLLNHFHLSKGFSLLVFLVLDADGAALCRRELDNQLQKEGKQLFAIEIPTPEDLRRLSSSLLDTQPPANAGCVWVAAVEPDYGKAYPEWRDAWQFAFARLNSHRNEMRRHFNLPLLFVGAPWLQEVMREIAPDLWSVRTLVVRIEPRPQFTSAQPASEPARFGFEIEKSGADPVFALKEAEGLRGVPGKELALARLLYRAGEGFASRYDWPSARKAYVEALELNQRAQAPPGLLMANLNQLAIACMITGLYQDAVSCLQTALKIAREVGDKRGEGDALGNLGIAYADLGQPRKAVEFYEQAMVVANQIGDRRGERNALGNIGSVCIESGEPRKAVEFYERALVISSEIGDRHGEAIALNNLGNAYKHLGEPRKAIKYCERALVIVRGIGDRRGEGNALGNLGNACLDMGKPHKAISLYKQSLAIAREIGDRRAEDTALGNLGNIYLGSGEPRKAIEFIEQALTISREIGDRFGEGSLLFNSALALYKLNDLARAIARAKESLQILKAIESPDVAKVEAQLAAWKSEVAKNQFSPI
jgi:tetratricopeptide (TPR) repeat protein